MRFEQKKGAWLKGKKASTKGGIHVGGALNPGAEGERSRAGGRRADDDRRKKLWKCFLAKGKGKSTKTKKTNNLRREGRQALFSNASQP